MEKNVPLPISEKCSDENQAEDFTPVVEFKQSESMQNRLRPVKQLRTEAHVKKIILEKLSETLKLDINLIDINEPFADFGIDAISEVHLVQVINQALMIELETTNFLDADSVERLTSYILSKYADKAIKAFGKNITQWNGEQDLSSLEQDKYRTLPERNTFADRMAFTEPVLADPAVERHIKEIMVETLSQSLKIDINLIDINESFADFGMDAITGARLIQVINQDLKIELEDTSLCDSSSVNRLTAYILARFKDSLTRVCSQDKIYGSKARKPLGRAVGI